MAIDTMAGRGASRMTAGPGPAVAAPRGALRRRDWLAALAGFAALGDLRAAGALAAAAGPAPQRLAATWRDERGAHGYHAGVLAVEPAAGGSIAAGSASASTAGSGWRLRVVASVELPTRAHGLALTPAGGLVVVARRPGDWLMHWPGPGHAPRWHWADALRTFNGHLVLDPAGRRIYTTETDVESGESCVGVRELRSLDVLDVWSTHGIDAHELAWDGSTPGRLLVANGGIPTRPETGRAKLELERMDPSLAALDAQDGRLAGQWRLDDKRLSLRHITWHAGSRTTGLALQAEHDDPAERANAPMLALFDGRALRVADAEPDRPLAGYGGDIAALPDGFVVSCTRANGVARYAADGAWRGFIPVDESCALETRGGQLWAGGHPLAEAPEGTLDTGGLRLDNHWRLWT